MRGSVRRAEGAGKEDFGGGGAKGGEREAAGRWSRFLGGWGWLGRRRWLGERMRQIAKLAIAGRAGGEVAGAGVSWGARFGAGGWGITTRR
jgi:hypothetical protein